MANLQDIYELRRTRLESIKVHEEVCVLPTFDGDVAWELGTLIRARCQQQRERPAVIYVAYANSFQLFLAHSRLGMVSNDMHVLKRKEATVLRWGISSLRMYWQIAEQWGGADLWGAFRRTYDLADQNGYTIHGGGFPIRVRNVDGVVGVIAVHGLDDDHRVIVESIQEYLARHVQE